MIQRLSDSLTLVPNDAILKPDDILENEIETLKAVLEKRADKDTFFSETGTFTGAEMLQKSAVIRDELYRRGARPGEFCAYAGTDDIGVLCSVFGGVRAGQVIFGLASFLSPEKWVEFIEQTKTRFVVCEHFIIEQISYALEEKGLAVDFIEVDLVGGLIDPTPGEEHFEDYAARGEDRYAIRFTSGSTGTPKGIIMTHDNGLYGQITLDCCLGGAEGKGGRFLSLTPPTDMAGWGFVCLGLYRNADIVLYTGKPSVEGIIRCIEQEHITETFLPSSQTVNIADNPTMPMADLSSLRRILYGGQKMPAAAIMRAAQQLDCELVQMFGQTETTPITYLTPEEHLSNNVKLLDSAGYLIPSRGNEVQIRDVDTHELLPLGQIGHIVARGPGVSLETLGFDEPQDMLGDWRNTYDVGYFDENGLLTVLGRTRDIILYRGFTIYAHDIEDSLAKIEGVKEVCAHPVSEAVDGEHIFVWIVTDPEMSLDKEVLAKEVEMARGAWYRPSYIEFIDEIPLKIAMKKYDKIELRTKAEDLIASKAVKKIEEKSFS